MTGGPREKLRVVLGPAHLGNIPDNLGFPLGCLVPRGISRTLSKKVHVLGLRGSLITKTNNKEKEKA